MLVRPGEQTLGGCPPGEWQWMQCENAATVTAVVLEGAYPQTRFVVEFELAFLPGVACAWAAAIWTEEEKSAGAGVPEYRDSTWLSVSEDVAASGPRQLRGQVGLGAAFGFRTVDSD
jgi:hypothetical protein